MINFSKKVVSTIFLFLVSTNLFAGLLPETMILVGNNNYKKVEDLNVGDPIAVYSIPNRRIERKSIQKIKVRNAKDVVLIKTDYGKIAFGLNQKVYNRRIYKVVPAKELKVGDKLFSPEKGSLIIKKISTEKLEDKIELYDVSIENGNLFLIRTENGTNILVHNFAITIPVFTWTFGGKVALTSLGTMGLAVSKSILNHLFNRHTNKSKKRKDNPNLDDTLKDTTPTKKPKGKSDVYDKDGGKEQREKDFDQLNKGDKRTVKTKDGTVIIGTTQNGETIVSRDFSSNRSENKPTIEIQYGKNDYLKIRYND